MTWVVAPSAAVRKSTALITWRNSVSSERSSSVPLLLKENQANAEQQEGEREYRSAGLPGKPGDECVMEPQQEFGDRRHG
jgi:hypothetical protein